MSIKFCVEATLHADYINNLTGGKDDEGLTPYEMVFGTKPNVGNILVFGCSAYLHEPKEKGHFKLVRREKTVILHGS